MQITSWAYQNSFLGGEPTALPQAAAMFQAWLWWGVEPCSPAAVFQAWQADLLVWYTTKGVASVEKGSVIIRYKLPELIEKRDGEPRSPVAMFQAWRGRESNPALR